jgi:hypothetical protein
MGFLAFADGHVGAAVMNTSDGADNVLTSTDVGFGKTPGGKKSDMNKSGFIVWNPFGVENPG